MAHSLKFTNTKVEQLKQPGQYQYQTLNTLHLSISPKGTKSWYVYKSWESKLFRMGLGRFPAITVDYARKQTQKILSDLAHNIDPREAKRRKQLMMR